MKISFPLPHFKSSSASSYYTGLCSWRTFPLSHRVLLDSVASDCHIHQNQLEGFWAHSFWFRRPGGRNPADGDAGGPMAMLWEPVGLADDTGWAFCGVCVQEGQPQHTSGPLTLLMSRCRKYLNPGNLWEGIWLFSNTSHFLNWHTVRSEFPKHITKVSVRFVFPGTVCKNVCLCSRVLFKEHCGHWDLGSGANCLITCLAFQ